MIRVTMDDIDKKQEKRLGQSEELLHTKIANLEPIEDGRNAVLRQKSDLAELVEGPLLLACEELYDKNITTLGTSANKKDVSLVSYDGTPKLADGAYIVIDFDSLTDVNRQIGENLGEKSFADDCNQLKIAIPLTPDSTFEDVQTNSLEIVKKLEQQPFKPVTYTLREMRQFFGYPPDDESIQVEDFCDYYYWVPELELFYLSREQFEKATEHVEEEPKPFIPVIPRGWTTLYHGTNLTNWATDPLTTDEIIVTKPLSAIDQRMADRIAEERARGFGSDTTNSYSSGRKTAGMTDAEFSERNVPFEIRVVVLDDFIHFRSQYPDMADSISGDETALIRKIYEDRHPKVPVGQTLVKLGQITENDHNVLYYVPKSLLDRYNSDSA